MIAVVLVKGVIAVVLVKAPVMRRLHGTVISHPPDAADRSLAASVLGGSLHSQTSQPSRPRLKPYSQYRSQATPGQHSPR